MFIDNDTSWIFLLVIAALFNERNAEKNGSAVYVVQLVVKFDATGSLRNKKRVYERDDAKVVAVLGHVSMGPSLGTRKFTNVCGGSPIIMMRILIQT